MMGYCILLGPAYFDLHSQLSTQVRGHYMCKLDPLGINDANLHVDKFQYRGSSEQVRSPAFRALFPSLPSIHPKTPAVQKTGGRGVRLVMKERMPR